MRFQEISEKSREEMKKYLEKAKNRGCNYTVGNILIWGADLPITYGIVADVIVFRTLLEKEVVYHIAEYTDDFSYIIQKLSEDARKLEKNMVFADLSREMIQALEEEYPGLFQEEFDRDGSDYVYETAALASLGGKKYHKKKNHVNRFKKNYHFTYEPITKENIRECMDMAEEWRNRREMNSSLLAEARALERAFASYEEFQFQGGLLRVEGKVMAFTFGEQATEDTFVTHFEKALDEIPELYAVINQQFAQHALAGYTYVNREEDLGVEGLRKAKTSYHPVFLVEKYKARFKEGYSCKDLCLWHPEVLKQSA